MIRKRALVSGRVQGVGFRAYTQYNASKLGISGWVRNVGYDKVEIEAQANQDLMEKFFATVLMGPSASRVDDIKYEDLKINPEDRGFMIRHSR